MKIFIYSVVL